MTTETQPVPPDRAPGRAVDAGRDGDGAADGEERVPRSSRWLVAVILAGLVVPGLVGAEAWPLTGWKLFSLSRDESQTAWVLETVDVAGESGEITLEDLPLGYRHAEWPMSDLLGASTIRRERVCSALLDAVVDTRPATVELRLVRDRQRMVTENGDWVLARDPEVFHTCRV